VVHEQTGGASKPIGPRGQLAHYRQRIQSLRDKLDNEEERAKFTLPTIRTHKQTLISIKEEIVTFKERLPARDRKVFNHLLDGVRDAILVLEDAEEKRALIDKMSFACKKVIKRAVTCLEHALDKPVDQ
jgi:hypothetical protein